MIDPSKPRSVSERIRHRLFGKPIASSKAHHERLSPTVGLAVFSSDSLSSVAYATEAILGVLILFATKGNLSPLTWQWPISLSIAALIVIIAFSYTQTIHAYPSGGGSYIVASDNLGFSPWGKIAGASLLLDYTLTVAVSISAGVAALVSAFPALHGHLVDLSLFFILIVGWANLRGVKESGAVFSVPTYGFVFSIIAMLIWGGVKIFNGGGSEFPEVTAGGNLGKEAEYAAWFIVLRAFAAGCTALTGIEAVADGTQSFRAPESKNAALTLKVMSGLLITMFLGMGWVASHLPQLTLLSATEKGFETVSSQVAAFSFGGGSFGYYTVQVFTTLILILAANTAYADFPRLCSFIARDGFLPRSLARQGDRLVFHNGIIVLSAAAALLVIFFKGELELLLPLYAIGVFTAFTLSQAGMVVRWNKLRSKGWQKSLAINLLGATLSFVVLCIIAYTKFFEGAWLVLVLMPLLYVMFDAIKRRYENVSRQLAIPADFQPPTTTNKHLALLLVPRVHVGMMQALKYAKLVGQDGAQAVHVVINEKTLPETRRLWERYGDGVPLTVLSSPYRSLIRPVLDYVDELLEDNPDTVITVIVAEATSFNFFHRLLQEPVAQQLKKALGSRRNVVVSNVRYFLN